VITPHRTSLPTSELVAKNYTFANASPQAPLILACYCRSNVNRALFFVDCQKNQTKDQQTDNISNCRPGFAYPKSP